MRLASHLWMTTLFFLGLLEKLLMLYCCVVVLEFFFQMILILFSKQLETSSSLPLSLFKRSKKTHPLASCG